ncbi:hypothetical protein DSM14862_02849 [Sulfitobacter indolifex]|nr:hypothetical protein DSM14862_02849 [Sulfitobacter indolifex]
MRILKICEGWRQRLPLFLAGDILRSPLFLRRGSGLLEGAAIGP